MRNMLAVLALVGVACGGGDTGQSAATADADATPPAAAPAAQAPVVVGTGIVHEVQMLGTPDGKFIYSPMTLTIRVGDRVRWVNVSGGPHNVAFYPNQIPPGAADYLNAAMVNRIGPLAGALMLQPNQAYEIAFVGAPVGTYEYFCTPHEMLGMKAQLTVMR